jgi:hypothetical protein
MGSGQLTPNVTSHSLMNGSTPVEHCVFDETNYSNTDTTQQDLGRNVLGSHDAIVIIPRATLEPGSTYVASITANGQVYSWTFTIGDPDGDRDNIPNTTDNCPHWTNALQDLPNWPIPAADSDCDGFSNSVGQALLAPESYIGTDPTTQCAHTSTSNDESGTDKWPMDFNDNQRVNGQDFLTFNFVMNQSTAGPPVTVPIMGTFPRTRWDFNGNGLINGQDFLRFNFFINKVCTP